MTPLKAFTLLSAAATATAARITPVEVKGGCSALPAYNPDTGIAGPWVIKTDGCVNTTSPESGCAMEGYGSGSVYRITPGYNGVKQGYITIVPINTLAKNPLRCTNPSTLEGWVPTGASGYTWQPLSISPIPYSAPLMWGLDSGRKPQFFHHYEDGKKVDGIFVGAGNTTDWGIQYQEAGVGSSGLDYWFLRLLGVGSADPESGRALGEGEGRTFVRVDGS